ncbi:MAG TPA: hypothetical protein VM386_05710 [Acidimicrobiales bacterium]|nr:hypothetical protein [Acidimicrobiales bacterium]
MSFLILDLSGHSLVRLVRVGGEPGAGGVQRPEEVPLDEAPYSEVVRTQRPQVLAENGQIRVTAPVTNRGDVIGVLELVVEEDPGPHILQFVAEAGLALAYVVRSPPTATAKASSPAWCCGSNWRPGASASSSPDTRFHCCCVVVRCARSSSRRACPSV